MLSILVTLAVVTTGFCTCITVAGAATVGLILLADCARFFKTEIAVAVVANDAESAGTVVGAVAVEVLPVPTTDEVTVAMSLTSALPAFYGK